MSSIDRFSLSVSFA